MSGSTLRCPSEISDEQSGQSKPLPHLKDPRFDATIERCGSGAVHACKQETYFDVPVGTQCMSDPPYHHSRHPQLEDTLPGSPKPCRQATSPFSSAVSSAASHTTSAIRELALPCPPGRRTPPSNSLQAVEHRATQPQWGTFQPDPPPTEIRREVGLGLVRGKGYLC